jgi:colanic acid/amylovoran biosynthesis glycosyltransferase
MTIGYLTSIYARPGDLFIRGEVAQLRALGYTVHTFSSRRPDPVELVSEEIRREHDGTEYLLDAGAVKMMLAALREAIRSPRRWLAAMRLAARIGTPGLDGRLRPFAYLVQGAYLAGLLEERGVRHLHNHIGESSASVAMFASALGGVPFSITIHGPSEFDSPGSHALGEKIHRASFVATVCDYGRSQLLRWSDYRDWAKVHVVRSGVMRKFLEGGPIPIPESRRLISIGRLVEAKGQLLLVEAAARLAAEGLRFELVLVGDGPMRDPIERLVEAHGLGEHVRLAGWLTSDQVRDEIVASRALVMASFAEGLPMVLMEALALGRPVVGTYVAGIPELVRPGTCGWLVPPGSVDALVVVLREVLSAPVSQLDRMGRAGAALVAEGHDPTAVAAEMAALINRSVGETCRDVPGGCDARPAPEEILSR